MDQTPSFQDRHIGRLRISWLASATLWRRALFLAVATLLAVGPVSFASVPGGSHVFERATLPDGMSQISLGQISIALPGGNVEVIVETVGTSLAQEQSSRKSLGLEELEAEGQRSHVRGLKGSQEALKQDLASLGGRVTNQFAASFSGVSVIVDAAKLPQISALPGVKAVHRTKLFSPDLDNSVRFIFGGKTNAELGVDGTGTTVAIIDTGIDYTHAALGGSGNPADYAGNDPTIIEPGTFPTAKVIGGIDLVGEFYDPECASPGVPPACSNIPVRDPDPLDIVGHGTHVAGIAAGMAAGSVPQGVAPGAKLLAVKVFGRGSTSDANIVAAIEFAMDPNQDGDTSDHVDVINMSLGSPFGSDLEPTAIAVNAAAALGVVVVASAGNSGDIPFITGSPASASGAISVAASNDTGIFIQLVEALGSGGADGMYEAVEAAFTTPLAESGARTGPIRSVGLACSANGVSPFPAGSLAGSIPLIERGTCTFAEKATNAQQAGAIGAVVFNNLPGGAPFAMGATVTVQIPAVMIGNAAGLALRDALLPSTTLSLDPANVIPIPNGLQDFTSTGPRFLDAALKPEISAPGGSVLSAAAGTGTAGISFSGTSMSAPHIAGVAALLRQLHPSWTAQAIKALMMNTATNNLQPDGTPYPLARMGAGRVRVDVAVNTESFVTPPSTSFAIPHLNSPVGANFRAGLTVTNASAATKTFRPNVSLLSKPSDGAQVIFDLPPIIIVTAGASKSFDFQVEVIPGDGVTGAAFEGREGFLTLTETTAGGDVLRVPFQLVPPALRSEAQAAARRSQIQLRNDGARGTLVDIYQLGVSDPNEALDQALTARTAEPDDWFDIKFTGAHAVDTPSGRVVEFAVAVHGVRSVANPMVTEVRLDVDKDAVPDYVVVAGDRGHLMNRVFDGVMVSALFETRSGQGMPQFVIANDPDASWQKVPFLLEDLNRLGTSLGAPTIDAANPDFDYSVVTTHVLAEVPTSDSTASARFNALAPALDAVPQIPFLAPGDRLVVDVIGTAQEGSLLVLFYNNLSGAPQSAVIPVNAP